ncbi:Exodeoxyribonuclease 1 [Mycena kentingensis (nom. inval.)]|nr:Exodeoxyribonuclease 1 [Mycena kentingensis (nom. inval.)]
MGITGLLPALRSISTQRHLSEFAGHTLGVDGYAWLHRGVFTCATELATGRETTKYVDYAMHRVRLLRHHGIEPYMVFDGGPLPAKKGTESDRAARRTEHLALGNALAAQGKTTQAREHYVKCVDVTPQMAKQLIKALKAENVNYVVAPYEADAQLAYLERQGIISGIITEDSDLLVFGCRNVLYKMDAVTATAQCISQDDFSRITTAVDGISLHGFSLAQFRAMAILSGCDYLASIPGIGLKTACSLLRKWRTAEQVVRAIRMEGKKSVPKGYMDKFRLAEKCFLHQRVYDPVSERLVHLTEPEEELSAEANAYVGPDMEPALAKRIAIGDADPETLKPMEDICPRFVPRALNPIPFVANAAPNRGKGKAPANGGIRKFFAPQSATPKPKSNVMVVGKASGKRSLSDEMDRDIAAKRKKVEAKPAQSRFFATSGSDERKSKLGADDAPVAGPSRLMDKENVPLDDEEDLEDEEEDIVDEGEGDLQADLEWDSLSLVVMPGRDETEYEVAQEDGYISPTPSRLRDTAELSSPVRPQSTPPSRKRVKVEKPDASDDSEAELDVLSSPADGPSRRLPSLNLHLFRYRSPRRDGNVLVAASPEPEAELPALDLRDAFGDERTSDIDCFDDDKEDNDVADDVPQLELGESATPTPSPPTPVDDPEEQEARASAARVEAVAAGWRKQWVLPKDQGRSGTSNATATPLFGGLRRRETTITPTGRHFPITRPLRNHPYSKVETPGSASSRPLGAKTKPLQTRKSLTFLEPGKGKKGEAEGGTGEVQETAVGGHAWR